MRLLVLDNLPSSIAEPRLLGTPPGDGKSFPQTPADLLIEKLKVGGGFEIPLLQRYSLEELHTNKENSFEIESVLAFSEEVIEGVAK